MLRTPANLLTDRHAEGYLGTPEGYLGSNYSWKTQRFLFGSGSQQGTLEADVPVWSCVA
jgi:hypothetical protein